jgi:hypothetical protein
MKALISLLTLVATLFTSVFTSAFQVIETKARPVDFRACTFRDGKSMADLEKVNEQFRNYANQHDFAYSAWVLTPQYHNGAGFDVGWLGSWPDGASYGASLEKWNSSGGDIAAKFNAVVDCSSRHELAMSYPINAATGAPRDGVVMFSACTLKDGKTMADAYAAHLENGIAMKAMGSQALSWFFQPALGASPIDFDYYWVVAFNRLAEMGATMDMYVNGGGVRKAMSILSKASTCGTPWVFDALSVRYDDER